MFFVCVPSGKIYNFKIGFKKFKKKQEGRRLYKKNKIGILIEKNKRRIYGCFFENIKKRLSRNCEKYSKFL